MIGYKEIKLGIGISVFIFNLCIIAVNDEIDGGHASLMGNARVPLKTTGLCFNVLKEHRVGALNGI